MKISASVLQAGGLAIFLHVGENQEVIDFRMMKLTDHMRFGFAKTLCKIMKLLRAKGLISDHQDMVI